MNLGKLKKIELRTAWKHEALDFTNWLAKEENLNLLSAEIGVPIRLNRTEAPVGGYSADILAEEENTGKIIIIENQLETTNHDHLGKIITYASGYDAEIIIWIVKDVREEHQKAIDWLNENSGENINFFLIKIELWQIGDSSLAPKFQIISKPNDWAKIIKNTMYSKELSDTALQNIDFLNQFINYAKEHNTKLRLGRVQPTTPSYYSIGIGNSNAWIAVKINRKKNVIVADLYFLNKEAYNALYKDKDTIEKEYGKTLNWDDRAELKGAVIGDQISVNLDKKNNWVEYFGWLLKTTESYQNIFLNRLKEIKKD